MKKQIISLSEPDQIQRLARYYHTERLLIHLKAVGQKFGVIIDSDPDQPVNVCVFPRVEILNRRTKIARLHVLTDRHGPIPGERYMLNITVI